MAEMKATIFLLVLTRTPACHSPLHPGGFKALSRKHHTVVGYQVSAPPGLECSHAGGAGVGVGAYQRRKSLE